MKGAQEATFCCPPTFWVFLLLLLLLLLICDKPKIFENENFFNQAQFDEELRPPKKILTQWLYLEGLTDVDMDGRIGTLIEMQVHFCQPRAGNKK